MNSCKASVILVCFCCAFLSCKKKEERNLVKQYEGDYIGTLTNMKCCDSLNQIIITTSTAEFSIKKSLKGIRIKGLNSFENFDVNANDNSFYADSKDYPTSTANGKFKPNDSVWLSISHSAKLPNSSVYNMKKK
jgi:hypothetical protein